MGDVLPFKKRKAGDKAKGKTLCRSGFHKWKADKNTSFDVREGKLVTRYVCERCGKTRVEAK